MHPSAGTVDSQKTAEFEAFAEGFASGAPQLVSRELVADTQTPVSAYLRLAANSRNTFLLESVEGGEIRGRFSVIGLAPDLIWRCQGQTAEINRDPASGSSFVADGLPPIEPSSGSDGRICNGRYGRPAANGRWFVWLFWL